MSTSSAMGPVAGGARRVAAALGLALVLLVPVSVIFVQFWTARTEDLTFNQDERRGVEYLGPLTELLSTVTEEQSGVVHGRSVSTVAVQRAVAAVDAVDRRLGARLQTTQRWNQLRQLIHDLTGRTITKPDEAFTAYSGVVDLTVALIRKVGDTSNLILDPAIDAYYVMNATLLRIPAVLVGSGRYSDLAKIVSASESSPEPERLAQLASARSQILAEADDLSAGLEKSFESTDSNTLGPALLRQLDDFRTAVDAVAPRSSPVQPLPAKSLDLAEIERNQDNLQQLALALDAAGLGQLDLLLKARVDAIARQRLYAVAALLAEVVVSAVVVVVWLTLARRARSVEPAPRPTAGRHGERPHADSVDARELVASSGMAPSARRGGARAAR
jgi:hypothetical protein